jgi:arsenite methyltransferase
LDKDSCCSGSVKQAKPDDETPTQTSNLKGEIRKRYGELAKSQSSSCCGPSSESVKAPAKSCCATNSCSSNAGYTEEQLRSLPDKAMAASAGCGNPTALADLKEGEVVLDLGSGGGIDVFLAAQKVGPKGKAIGVDMTPEMIDLARENSGKSNLKNVEFRLGEIEHLPVADESVDVIISNCVINLSTDKDQVFKEAHRVLKSGGRLLVSDVMADGLPEDVRGDISVWARCVGGAIGLKDYMGKIRNAGFSEVKVVTSSDYSKEFVKDSVSAADPSILQNADLLEKVEDIRVSHAEIQARKF